ncbi:MAG: hypothetical protein ACR2MX_01215, partial [Cyclobacteriaceae bacterium]
MKASPIFLMLLILMVKSALAQENDNCADAIILTVDNACKASIYTNIGASAEAETIAQDPSCGLYQGGDVW